MSQEREERLIQIMQYIREHYRDVTLEGAGGAVSSFRPLSLQIYQETRRE